MTLTSTGGTATSFQYDGGNAGGDGNVTSESGGITRTINDTPFNQPQSIAHAGKIIRFAYDAEHNRTHQAAPEGTTFTLPDGELTPDGNWHTYFMVGGQRVAEDYGTAAPFQHHYFHTDYQGTISLVTDDNFNPRTPANDQNELSDAFGQPRLLNGAIDPQWGSNDVTRRRYINQEDLLDAQLIDLNARLYDPELGKFLSPDPIIADIADSQTWNPYDYATNNPMSDEDPTGLTCQASGTKAESCSVTAMAPPVFLMIGGGGVHVLRGEAAGVFRRAAAGNTAAQRTLASRGQAYETGNGFVNTQTGQEVPDPGMLQSIASQLQLSGDIVGGPSFQVAQAAMGLCVLGPEGCAAGAGITAGQALLGAGAATGGAIVFMNGIPKDAKDPNGAKAPGKPGPAEGFKDPKGGERWVKNPNGRGYGWLDDKGRVWVPSGQGASAHGGPQWDVQTPGGGYDNVYPGGHVRPGG